MAESLLLKWGTLKGWEVETEKSKDALRRYLDEGASISCVMQRDTPSQKQSLLDLIDAIDGEIWLDWDNRMVTKDEAKTYITGYRKND